MMYVIIFFIGSSLGFILAGLFSVNGTDELATRYREAVDKIYELKMENVALKEGQYKLYKGEE